MSVFENVTIDGATGEVIERVEVYPPPPPEPTPEERIAQLEAIIEALLEAP
jgi:hypothetical protein